MSGYSDSNIGGEDNFEVPKETHGDNPKHEEEEDEKVIRQKAQDMSRGVHLAMALKTAIELDILEIISEASEGGAYLSAYEVACKIPGCVNPDAPSLLDSVLSLLASFSVLKCEIRNLAKNEEGEEAGVERVYGVAPVCKYYLKSKASCALQESLVPLHLWRYDKVSLDFWYRLNDAILEGGIPFNKAHGTSLFEYTAKDARFSKVFNNAMSSHTTITIKKILEVYQGFEGINVLVDVGGGVGTTLNLITSKYPNIKGINFDLPHVVTNAAAKSPGVEHVGGDMFEEVPRGDAIMLKWILHDWKDMQCLKILKNCWKALPKDGKVIVVESLLPLAPKDDIGSQSAVGVNLTVFAMLGTLERNIEEYKTLAFNAGFSSCDVVCSVHNKSVIEFRKA